MIHPKQLHPRRHVFQGHATGVSAHIRRPEKHLLESKGSSALPPTGGHFTSSDGPKSLGKWVSYQSVETSAYGDYADAEQGRKTTLGEVAFDAAPVVTRISSRVQGLDILGRLRIADLSLGMVSRSAQDSSQPSIQLENNRIDGVTIDGSKLKIDLAEGFYSQHDTKDKLKAAHDKGLPEQHARMFLPCKVGEEEVKSFPEANGAVKCTIVQNVSWDGAPHSDAQIHGHVVVVPGFGKIYFGEMSISADTRRLTLVRCQLGSDDGGEVSAGDGQTNGQTFPPTGG
ncbi:MAG TPA: hypothetical protein VMH28_25610 [Candidatus Acidoferrales bacterium]|nr:hypothetical protein [Candidatus Acidoferrales bacterium]